MKIGILGGTFDPIHNGHLIIGEYARTSLNLDKIIFIPVGIAPHKDNNNITCSNIRVKMIELAIKSNLFFEQSLIEVERDKTAYTIDTIISLRELYKDDDLYFIMGGDSLFEIESWKDAEKLMKLCKFIVLDRGYSRKEDIREKMIDLEKRYGMKVQEIESPIIEISSTEIRKRIKNKRSIKYLVPEILEEYILENKIYE